MSTYRVYDRLDTGSSQWIEAESPEEAIDEWLQPGYETAYDTSRGPVWLDVVAEDEDGDIVGQRDIIIPQAPPECYEDEHDWAEQSVTGHGGGVIVTDVCRHCGVVRVTDTWHQDSQSGRVWPVDHVSYREADDVSLEWAEAAG